ncbi:MAG: Uma2 family endonuclease [Isosphaeraceae bacterium]
MSKTITKVGPADHGRRMSLDDFEEAEGEDGYLYELSRGVVTVVEIPHPFHFRLVDAIDRQLRAYLYQYPGRIVAIGGGAECKLLIEGLQSERHPDLAVYKTAQPDAKTAREIWRRWVPEIVIEVASRRSRNRDYGQKPEEYLRLGVKEYWIVDAEKRATIVMRRSRGRWIERTIRPPAGYRTRLLPGLVFSCSAVFETAGLA